MGTALSRASASAGRASLESSVLSVSRHAYVSLLISGYVHVYTNGTWVEASGWVQLFYYLLPDVPLSSDLSHPVPCDWRVLFDPG